MSINAGGRPSPRTVPHVIPVRCCARCKTPYNCGNGACGCHEVKS